MEGKKIKSFQDLIAWQEAHKLVLSTYKITKHYPAEERFGLTSQSRGAVVSISSNIAEGFGRFSSKDKHHFYAMAKTSLAELQNQLIVARDLSYITKESFSALYIDCDRVGGLIKGLMRSTDAR